MRAAVAGHRDVTLAGELATAREVLRAAGIVAELPGSVDIVDPTLSELFGWVIREGVTNVVRHARAAHCTITVDRNWIEIADDGRGGIAGAGNGLTGLRERVEAAGGTVQIGAAVRRMAVAGRRAVAGTDTATPADAFVDDHGVIRLLLADDQALVRSALAALLDLEDDFEVVAQVGPGRRGRRRRARSTGRTSRCSTSRCPAWTGWPPRPRCAHEVPACRVIILTSFGRPGYLRRAMESGALGFVVKDAPAEQLADAVRRVVRGERVVDPALAAATLAGGASPLTGRERDVLVAARDGATVADIAGEAVPLRGDGAQLPVGGDRQDRRAQSGRGGAGRRRARLALPCGAPLRRSYRRPAKTRRSSERRRPAARPTRR